MSGIVNPTKYSQSDFQLGETNSKLEAPLPMWTHQSWVCQINWKFDYLLGKEDGDIVATSCLMSPLLRGRPIKIRRLEMQLRKLSLLLVTVMPRK